MDTQEKKIEELAQFEKLINGLIDNDFGCCDDFTNQETSAGLRSNLLDLQESGAMYPSGVGNKKEYQKNNLIRGDKIKWLNENSEDSYEAIIQKKIEEFILHLNATCYTSIKKFESHYASYDPNSFYKRHIDQFKNDKERKYSFILYLNENWKDEDGGMLSLYPIGRKQIDIAPIEGRIVFFKSDEMEHEVHPSVTRSRMSIAGWLKNEKEYKT